MRVFHINYFNEKTVPYFGTLDGAIDYAELMARNYALCYRGSIVIADEYGNVYAQQDWVTNEDGSSEPLEWHRL